MVCIDVETPGRTEARLREIMKSARLQILRDPFAWEDIPQAEFPAGVKPEAVAVTRIDQGWSQLVPSMRTSGADCWALFCFQFVDGGNGEGFLEWFAGNLSRRVGPRLMNVTGFSAEGSKFDYWAVPWSLRERAIREVAILTTTPFTGVRAVGLL